MNGYFERSHNSHQLCHNNNKPVSCGFPLYQTISVGHFKLLRALLRQVCLEQFIWTLCWLCLDCLGMWEWYHLILDACQPNAHTACFRERFQMCPFWVNWEGCWLLIASGHLYLKNHKGRANYSLNWFSYSMVSTVSLCTLKGIFQIFLSGVVSGTHL